MNTRDRFQELVNYLKTIERCVVAFSGGVDSSLLLYAAHEALGERVVGLTINTPYIPDADRVEAAEFAKNYSITHEFIELPIPEGVIHNPPDRCYHCKIELFSALVAAASQMGISLILEGSNQDDLSDYRPGLKALEELDILSPYLKLKITKREIREMARNYGLTVWSKPSNACLLSRIEYDTDITDELLERVKRADQLISELGLSGSRVRSHGSIARIEIPVERFEEVMTGTLRVQLIDGLKACGYAYVTLDLEGYQSGSMNKEL